MKTALHLMVAAGLLGIQFTVPSVMSCSSSSDASCCCTPQEQFMELGPASCCSAEPAETPSTPVEHECTCSMGPGPVLPPETNLTYVVPPSLSLVHWIQVISDDSSFLDTSSDFKIPELARGAGPPGDPPSAYQLNCVYLI